ncbi:hypothetical protein DSL72_004980 [Monilinia vaccinii-corymbosi]|uniref:SMP-30/Gluconolactonase/LRE-like region domain-containing protein n=1 Tax=Monilinia vaccinii-corymbosi TaxID=61207 RepID=A0A8A3PDY7_9HELO|nr:hypothetical protein DSL72_004980 [Monilinia vaccinii-corymbosi]
MLLLLAVLAATAAARGTNGFCSIPLSQQHTSLTTIGLCSADLDVIGPNLEAIHESTIPPTGLALDSDASLFFTYARNREPQKWTLTKATGFITEVPWPSEEWQNCKAGQNASECFVKVQNVVWMPRVALPTPYGAKIMSFNSTSGELIRNYIYPPELYYAKIQLNDIKINNTLGNAGYAFITEDSAFGSISTIDLETCITIRHLFNKGTTPSYLNSGTNGIALTGSNIYWGVKASNHWYFAPQEAFISNLTDAEIEAQIQKPGNFPSEQAGFTADDRGRVYICASAQNAILYADTLQCEVTEEINGVPAGRSGPVPAANYNLKTLVRSGQLQAADTMAILDGYLYFTTNQQGLAPARQYNNIDKRKASIGFSLGEVLLFR